MPNLANPDYVDRINRAIDHVTRNLGEPLDLDAVAKVACFSPHHFHRIFRALVGETLGSFIKLDAPAHQPGFEAWNGRPFAHGFSHFELRVQLPVVDASAPL